MPTHTQMKLCYVLWSRRGDAPTIPEVSGAKQLGSSHNESRQRYAAAEGYQTSISPQWKPLCYLFILSRSSYPRHMTSWTTLAFRMMTVETLLPPLGGWGKNKSQRWIIRNKQIKQKQVERLLIYHCRYCAWPLLPADWRPGWVVQCGLWITLGSARRKWRGGTSGLHLCAGEKVQK